MTDEQIVKGCIAGEPIYQRYLYEKFQGKMLGVCARYVKDLDDAQDILQDGFIQVFRKIGDFQNQGSLEGWIRRIMVNMALMHIRKNKKMEGQISIDDVSEKIDSGEMTLDNINAKDIMKFIHQLPDGYRMVFNLYAVEGYSHKEIAEMLNISVNTSFSQYSRAKTLLKKLLEVHKVA